MSMTDARSNRDGRLAGLRRRIRMIERGGFGIRPVGSLNETMADGGSAGLWEPFDREVTSRVRPDEGQILPALHELIADGYGSRPAVRDFGLALAASLLHRQGNAKSTVLWCQRRQDIREFGRPYGPGLLNLGLRPEQLIMVTGRKDADCLWAMEQGLRSRSLAVVIGMVQEADLISSRRLSLAASAHRTWCLLLPTLHGQAPSVASTRWRIEAAPSLSDRADDKLLGRPRWQLTLERSRNGRSGRWIVEWDHAAYRFHLAPPMANQPAARRSSPNDMARRHGQNEEGAGVLGFERAG